MNCSSVTKLKEVTLPSFRTLVEVRPQLRFRHELARLPEDRAKRSRGELAVQRHGEDLRLAGREDAAQLRVASPRRSNLESERLERAERRAR